MEEPQTREHGDEYAREVVDAVGHYMAAVAEHLLRSGVAVTDIGAFDPVAEELDGVLVVVDDVCGQVGLALRVQASISKSAAQVSLEWDAISGWRLFRAAAKGRPDGQARWLGRGLVPEPDRVELFVLAGQLDFTVAGSDEEPAYRLADRDYAALLDRLGRYADEPGYVSRGWKARWHQVRGQIYTDKMVGALVNERTDPVVDFPLRASEVAALRVALECAELELTPLGSEVLEGLAGDLAQRTAGDRSSAELHRRGLDAAKGVDS